jgi:hypothetical protein
LLLFRDCIGVFLAGLYGPKTLGDCISLILKEKKIPRRAFFSAEEGAESFAAAWINRSGAGARGGT